MVISFRIQDIGFRMQVREKKPHEVGLP